MYINTIKKNLLFRTSPHNLDRTLMCHCDSERRFKIKTSDCYNTIKRLATPPSGPPITVIKLVWNNIYYYNAHRADGEGGLCCRRRRRRRRRLCRSKLATSEQHSSLDYTAVAFALTVTGARPRWTFFAHRGVPSVVFLPLHDFMYT